jgi:hypothetical protein
MGQPMAVWNENLWKREAIWLANNQACYYCKRPIQFENVEIDHFIKRSVSVEEFAALVSQGVIDAKFDVESVENLVPTCPRHNRDKGDLSLRPDYVAIQIPKIARIAEKVRNELKKSGSHWVMERICREIVRGEESGEYSFDEIARFLDQQRNVYGEPPVPPEPLNDTKPPRPEILMKSRASIALRQQHSSIADLAMLIARRDEQARFVTIDGVRLLEFRLRDQMRALVEVLDDVIIVHDVRTKKSSYARYKHP